MFIICSNTKETWEIVFKWIVTLLKVKQILFAIIVNFIASCEESILNLKKTDAVTDDTQEAAKLMFP